MDILRGDVVITKNVLTELLKITSSKLEGEIRSGIYSNDYECPSHAKLNGLVDALVLVDECEKEKGFDKRE